METQNHVHNVRFQASLSNGETIIEDRGNFLELPGELSPWQKLLKYISENKLIITSLSLFTDDGRTFNLPSLGKNPRFSAFDTPIKPSGFILERQFARDIVGGNESDLYTTISALYRLNEKQLIKLSVWVDERNTKNSWSLINFIQEN